MRTSAWRPCRFLLMSDMVAMRPAGCGVSELIAGPGCWWGAAGGLCAFARSNLVSLESGPTPDTGGGGRQR